MCVVVEVTELALMARPRASAIWRGGLLGVDWKGSAACAVITHMLAVRSQKTFWYSGDFATSLNPEE